MKTENRETFPGRMLQPLDELAHQLLDGKQYVRLREVSELLAGFAQGGWDQLEEEAKRDIVEQLAQDFHFRAWDDWDRKEGDALSRIMDLIAAEKRAIGIK